MPRKKKEEPETRTLSVPTSPRSLLELTLVGVSPLVVHRFSTKARNEIATKQQKLAKLPKAARDPEAEFEDALYMFDDGGYGIPTGAIAEAIVNASVDVMPKKKSMIRRNLWVEDDGFDARENRGLIRLTGEPKMREDVVRLAGISRTADLRYRPEFDPWKMTVRVRFDANMLEPDQVMQLAMIAGESIGLCEGRPEKTLAMGWGKFRIENAKLTDAKAA